MNTIKKEITIRPPEMDECEFILTCEPEYDSPEGSFASSDDERDAEDVARIIAESQWNEWAWCIAKVECNWRGIKGEDFLGGCNYASEKDFREGGYFEDMKTESYRRMIESIEAFAGKEGA